MTKKASLFSWALVFVGLIILTSAMVIMIEKKNRFVDDEGLFTIGSKQYKLLGMYQKGENALLFVDLAAKYSVYDSLYYLGLNGGYSNTTLCGDYLGYPIWVNGTGINKNCFPDFKRSFTELMQDNMNKWLSNYPETYFPKDNYEFSLLDNSILGIALEPIQIIEEYVRGIGNPNDKDNEIQYCDSGDCVAKRAKYYAKLYGSLPYVWGGESPYTYDVSVKDQLEKGEDSVFYGISLTKYQPPGSAWSGRLTVPGFDCTGFVWWILKHSGIELFYRDSAYGLYIQAKRRATLICSLDTSPCTKRTIKRYAEPGDVLFIDPCEERGICHAAIYIGNNQIVESIGTSGPVIRDIPNWYYPGGEYEIHSIYRPNYQSSYEAPVTEEEEDVRYDAPIEPATSAQYSVKPSFRVPIDHGLNVYNKIFEIINKSNGLIADSLVCELRGYFLSDCIELEMDAINANPDLVWSINCDQDKERMFYTFIEEYLDCLNAIDNDCVCNLSLDYQESFENKEYEINVNQDSSNIIFSLGHLNYTIPFSFLMEAYELENKIIMRSVDNIRFEIECDNNEFGRVQLFIDNKQFNEDEKLHLYRTEGGYVGFLPRQELEKVEDYNICKIPEKRIYRFCVDTNKRYMVYDENNEEVQNKDLIIKFAVSFPEII